MRIALHAHALLAAVQPAPTAQVKQDIEADLRRQYLGRAFQCAACGFGPIDHFACSDLQAHHGEEVDGGGVVSNACPRCDWFSEDLADWPKWDGSLPSSFGLASAVGATEETVVRPNASALEIALRICYSVRAQWQTSQEG